MTNDWKIFWGDEGLEDRSEEDEKKRLIISRERLDNLLTKNSPKWRKFGTDKVSVINPEKDKKYWDGLLKLALKNQRDQERGRSFRVRPVSNADNQTYFEQAISDVIQAVNAALYLRRPLLITGRPGSGKTSLAYAVAYELSLGPVLLWPITARSSLQDGLYQYDAIARLQDAQFEQMKPPIPAEGEEIKTNYRDIGQYIRLGPVGTAFIPSKYPRVLLIDEIDKSDINLPNDLLNLFEEGEYEIPELVRLTKGKTQNKQDVQTEDGLRVDVLDGKVTCREFPLVIMTSNGERDFPPAFYRRCLRVEMPDPDENALKSIVKAHLGVDAVQKFEDVIQKFDQKNQTEEVGLATDQLLNIVYLLNQNADRETMERLLLNPLSQQGQG
ncbi:MAG: MoxR family ATPase [Thermosynechococcaceae cyanobacterium]